VIILTSDGGVSHVAIAADIDVNAVMDGFQAIAGASTVTHTMVAERWPSLDSSQHVVRVRGDIGLRSSQDT